MRSTNQMPIFNLRMDPETRRKLEELAEVEERDGSKMIRHLINQAWEQKFVSSAASQTNNAPMPPTG